MNQQDLLAVAEEAWTHLDDAVAGLDDAAWIKPGVVEQWSVKDLIGHVTAWDDMALSHVEQSRRGEEPAGDGGASVDAFNAAQAALRRDWTLEQVRAEATRTRQNLRAALASLTDAEWDTPFGAGEDREPLGDHLCGALNGSGGPGTHAAEHAAHIRAWRAARSHTVEQHKGD